MSALAMLLAAGLVVGDVPQKVSGEVEERLDLRGKWEGIWKDDSDDNNGIAFMGDGKLLGICKKCYYVKDFTNVTDEGSGKFSVQGNPLGIYRQNRDHLILCFRSRYEGGRPLTFRAGDGQHLLILHRVKAKK